MSRAGCERAFAVAHTDGKIHTDSKTKIITVLLYMNDKSWPSDTGRLRILRNGTDLEDYADEVEPAGGTLIVFKRSDKSWHGHHSYEGPRRAIQPFCHRTHQIQPVGMFQRKHEAAAVVLVKKRCPAA